MKTTHAFSHAFSRALPHALAHALLPKKAKAGAQGSAPGRTRDFPGLASRNTPLRAALCRFAIFRTVLFRVAIFRAAPLPAALALAALLALPGTGLALDSTFNPVSGIVTPQAGSSIPVGTVITWPVESNPLDWDNWLECDGSSVSSASYPTLVAILSGSSSATSATLPDYRGLFLRGRGYAIHQQINGTIYGTTSTLHLSGNLGEVQGDAIRNIYGTLPAGDALNSSVTSAISGVFSWMTPASFVGFASTDQSNVLPFFSASRVVPTAEEVRPVNKAVRYLIRAK